MSKKKKGERLTIFLFFIYKYYNIVILYILIEKLSRLLLVGTCIPLLLYL